MSGCARFTVWHPSGNSQRYAGVFGLVMLCEVSSGTRRLQPLVRADEPIGLLGGVVLIEQLAVVRCDTHGNVTWNPRAEEPDLIEPSALEWLRDHPEWPAILELEDA